MTPDGRNHNWIYFLLKITKYSWTIRGPLHSTACSLLINKASNVGPLSIVSLPFLKFQKVSTLFNNFRRPSPTNNPCRSAVATDPPPSSVAADWPPSCRSRRLATEPLPSRDLKHRHSAAPRPVIRIEGKLLHGHHLLRSWRAATWVPA